MPLYRVHYGYHLNGKLQSEEHVQDVIAADSKESTIKAVFASNGFTRSGKTLEILAIVNSGNAAGAGGFIQ